MNSAFFMFPGFGVGANRAVAFKQLCITDAHKAQS